MSKGAWDRITFPAYIEPFILYLVLFLPSWVFFSPDTAVFSFSINQELVRIFTYNLPSLALIWYLLFHIGRPFSPLSGLRPRLRDLITVFFALPCLLALGALVSLLGMLFPDPVSAPDIGVPLGWAAFLVMILSCLSTGYLEESYFRFYLFTRFKEGGVGPVKAMIVSSILFALCHVYEGPLGALNAFLAGLLLFFIFSRRRSLHGIAWAHGAYNIFVYVMAGITSG